MIKTLDTTKVVNFLCSLDAKGFNMLGTLTNSQKANKSLDIYVDDQTDIKAVALVSGGKNFSEVQITCYDTGFVKSLLEQFKKGRYLYFGGVEAKLAEYLRTLITQQWCNPCDCYFYPSKQVLDTKSNFVATSINLKDAAEVDSYYTYRSEHSLKQITEEITNRPSAAIYIDGEIASWSLTHFDNSMGAMFTKPKFRKMGLAEIVTKHHLRQLIECGITPYVQIVTDNTASKNLATKCGFVSFGQYDHFGGKLK